MEGGAHDLIHQVKGGQSLNVHLEQAVPSRTQIDLPFPGVVLPGNALTGQGPGQKRRGLIFVNFIRFQVNNIQVIFSQTLEAAEIFITNGVALAEGGAFELPRPDFGDIVGQLRAHRLFQAYGFNHVTSLETRPGTCSRQTQHWGAVLKVRVVFQGVHRQVLGLGRPVHVHPRQSLWRP